MASNIDQLLQLAAAVQQLQMPQQTYDTPFINTAKQRQQPGIADPKGEIMPEEWQQTDPDPRMGIQQPVWNYNGLLGGSY